jgi:hypothetical protein
MACLKCVGWVPEGPTYVIEGKYLGTHIYCNMIDRVTENEINMFNVL